MKRTRAPALAALAVACSAVHAGESPARVTFDATLLRGAREGVVDLSAFESGHVVTAGVHEVDVVRNGERLGRRRVRFDDDGVPCFDAAFGDWLGLSTSLSTAGAAIGAQARDCTPVAQWHPAARADYDAGELTLQVTVPQALLRRRDDAIDPALLDAGLPALRVSAGASVLHHDPRDGASGWRQGSLRIEAGANAGAWRLRHRGMQTWAPTQGRRSHPLATTLERDVLRFDARLVLGDLHAADMLFDPVALRGVRFQSDDRMVPASQSQPVPIVRGVADSHARVRVTHDGRLLLDTTVPPGPFALDSARPPGRGGVLSVEVIEADGRTRTFEVPYARAPGLLREGRARFGLAAGLLRDVAGDVPLLQGTMQHALHDRFTLHGGARVAPGHAEALAGAALATAVGAWSVDRTESRSTIRARREGGAATRLAWAMEWADAGTTLDVGTWRRDHAGVHALRDVMHARQAGVAPAHALRSRIDASLRQRVGDRRLALSAGIVDRRFDVRSRARSLQFGASLPVGFDGAWLQALFERGDDYGGHAPSQATLALSLPLQTGAARTTSFAHAHARAGPAGTAVQSGIGGTFGAASPNAWRIGIAHANRDYASVSTANASVSHVGRAGRIDIGAGILPHQRQWSLSGEGAVVLHPHGATFGATLGDTLALVRADHGEGARLLQASHVALDRRGRALVPSLSPYRRNRIGVDPAGASHDVAFDWTERDVIPRAGAVVDVPLPTRRATWRWLRILDASDVPLPFGAEVIDATGQPRGRIGREGQAYVQRSAGEALHVEWQENDTDHRCTLTTIDDPGDAIHDVRCIDASPRTGDPMRER